MLSKMIQRIFSISLMVSLGGLGLAACGAGEGETGDGTAESSEDAAIIPEDLDEAQNPHPEACGGECCRFKCNDGSRWWNPTPACGQCTNYAQFFCKSYGHGGLGGAWWGVCY
jgi:hypothetical protein